MGLLVALASLLPGCTGLPQPQPVATTPAVESRGILVVSHRNDRSLSFINPLTREIVSRTDVAWEPREILLDRDGIKAYVSNEGGVTFGPLISVVSLTSRQEEHRIDLGRYRNAHGLSIGRTGIHMYAVSGSTALEINLLSEQVERTFATGGVDLRRTAVSDDETRLYITDAGANSLIAVNLVTGGVTRTAVGAGPEDVAVAPDGLTVWVTNADGGTVTVLDPNTLAQLATTPAGRSPVRVEFTPDGRRALVVDAEEGTIAAFDAASRARVGSIPLPRFPWGLAIEGSGKRAYVASIRDDEITVVDLQTLQVVDHIPVGWSPVEVVWVDQEP